ncbi:MAG: T9SS type A sorting domain-containing protein, partial [Bacteroidetes bacterium]|nr:T9SS type A sorting domain-containing protein [Bacteroidota bacterium]
NTNRAENAYNSDNFVTTYTTTTWDTTASSWVQKNSDQQSRYYYEAYTGLLVNNTNNINCDLSLYPSPASSYINIDLKWDNTQPCLLAIYDMNGKLYKQWQTTAGNSYHASVPVNQLPAGNYILEVQNDKGQTAKQFSIVR